MKYLIVNWRKQFVFAALTAFVFLFAVPSLIAQTSPRKYKAGDVIDVGNDTTLEIVECRVKPNTRNEEECDYIAFRGGSPSNIVTDSVFNIRRYEQLAAAEKKRLEVINRRTQPKNQTKPPVEQTPEKTEPEDGNASSEEAELTVTAKQLYDEYQNNDIAAKRKYVGKMVRVTGAVVYTISETVFSARFNKIYSGSTIQCYLEDIEQAATLNKGETLTLVGVPLGSQTSTGVIFEPCRVERKTADSNTKPTTPKTPVKTPVKNTGNVVGTWYYTAIINADGTEKKLNNSESYLWLKEDGNYENRFGSSYGQSGTFAASGSRLTLNRENGEKQVYTMSVAGTTMTLKSGAGGYKLEKE